MKLKSCAVATFIAIVLVSFEFVESADQQLKIDDGHKLLQEAHVSPTLSVGDKVKALWFKDVSGNGYYLDELTDSGPVVFAFLSTKCPHAKRYSMRLNRMYDQFLSKGVTVVGVYPNSDETVEGISGYATKAELSFPIVRDVQGYVTKRLGATMTPQVMLIDSHGTLRYRGAVDDNRYENRVRNHYLVDAITAVLAGDDVATTQTKTLGCTVHCSQVMDSTEVTYASHVARILQDNCQVCHREGEVAPFTLTNYEEARTWATEIKEYTHSRLMPPWKPAPGFGQFKEVRLLTENELSLVARWVEAGMPKGDAADLPPAAKFNNEWALGEPDMIVEMPEEYELGPEGEDDYRHFIIPIELPEDKFVEAIDVRPGNRQIVHHVIAYVDKSGKARELDAADPGPGYTRFGGIGFDPVTMLGGWAPGQSPTSLPEGTGRWLPSKGDVVLQVHYYRSGVVEKDRTKVGLYFSKAKDPIPAHFGAAINTEFTIPPGESHCKVVAKKKIKEPVYIVSVYPHMHLLGKEMKVTASLPSGEDLPLVWIKNWDFNWQSPYFFTELQFLPTGSVIKAECHFDNSAENPNNPNDPPKPVGWGEKTTDEMALAFYSFIKASDYSPEDKVALLSSGD